MKKLKLLLLFSALAFGASAQVTVVDSIYTGGLWRSYRLYVPASYTGSTSVPLILNLHGYTSNAAAQQLYTYFGPIADTANFLMVYPQGTTYAGQPFWNAGISSLLVNDVQFLSNLIDSISMSYNVDQDAVFSCGMSNGGYMSHTLACALNNKIAAIASVTGSILTTQYVSCVPNRAVPVMQISGTADPTVPYNGTSSSVAVDTAVKYWVTNNHCNPTPAFSNVPNISTSDGCTAEHYVYSGGDNGSSVELYKIIGGEHTWPGAFPFGGVTNQDFKASEKIWLFFRKYRLAQFTTGIAEAAQQSAVVMYPNPATDLLTIEGKNISSVTIMDMNGKAVIDANRQQIDISGLAKGIYSVVILEGNNRIVKKLVKI